MLSYAAYTRRRRMECRKRTWRVRPVQTPLRWTLATLLVRLIPACRRIVYCLGSDQRTPQLPPPTDRQNGTPLAPPHHVIRRRIESFDLQGTFLDVMTFPRLFVNMPIGVHNCLPSSCVWSPRRAHDEIPGSKQGQRRQPRGSFCHRLCVFLPLQ